MLVFITGPDSFLASEAINKIKAKYIEKNKDGGELIQIDPDSIINWADLQAVPLFASSRLVVIRSAGKFILDAQQNLAYFLKNLPATTVVVLWDDNKLDPKTELATNIKDIAKQTISAELHVGASLQKWISARAKSYELVLNNQQISEIIESIGSDLWAINSELVRLSNSDNGKIAQGSAQKELERFASFRLVRQGKWQELGVFLSAELSSGMAVEMIMGGLASAVRKEMRSADLKMKITDLIMDIDVGLKTGLLDELSAIALLMVYLPQPLEKRVQWEHLWEDLAYL